MGENLYDHQVAPFVFDREAHPGEIVANARASGPDLLFVARRTRGMLVANIGQVLFISSLLAAVISFHRVVAREAPGFRPQSSQRCSSRLRRPARSPIISEMKHLATPRTGLDTKQNVRECR